MCTSLKKSYIEVSSENTGVAYCRNSLSSEELEQALQKECAIAFEVIRCLKLKRDKKLLNIKRILDETNGMKVEMRLMVEHIESLKNASKENIRNRN